jgi:hypothetical protein
MRALIAVAIAIALLLGACGGDDDSNPATTPSGATTGATAKAAQRSGAQERSSSKGKTRSGRRAGGETRSIFFRRGKMRCSTTPTGILASLYGVSTDDSKAIARAYADREAPGVFRKQAVAGCLAGLESRGG